MKKKRSVEIGVLTVAEAIELLQSLPNRYDDWPIYCCGSDECYLCFNEEEGYIIADTENLFDEFGEEEWTDDFL